MNRPDPGSWLARAHTRASSWQLPVRIPVPNRNNLIAMGLMALAFGLMVGVALGPLGGPSNAVATVVAGLPTTVADTPATDGTETAAADVPALGAPAGSESSSPGSSSLPSSDQTALVPSSDTSIDTSSVPTDSNPVPTDDGAGDYVAPEIKGNDDDPVKSQPGTPLKGTVVSQGANAQSYAIADSSGNVLALHGSTAPPLASQVSTRIDPLENGTFGEEVKWKADGEDTDSPIRGVVSYIDPETGWIVVSNRGASVAVDAAAVIATGEQPVEVGSQVEGEVTFPVELRDDPDSGPLLLATKLEAIGDPGDFIELNGRVLTLDEATGVMTMAPDSGGRIDKEVPILIPDDLDPETVDIGRTFNATVELTAEGFLLTGLSADYSRKAADDLSTAFGDLK